MLGLFEIAGNGSPFPGHIRGCELVEENETGRVALLATRPDLSVLGVSSHAHLAV